MGTWAATIESNTGARLHSQSDELVGNQNLGLTDRQTAQQVARMVSGIYNGGNSL